MLAVDLDNYDFISASDIDTMRAAGVGLAIIQAIDPPHPFPSTKTRAQLSLCALADPPLPSDCYIWLFPDDSVSNWNSRVRLGDSFPVRTWWIDFEDPGLWNLPPSQVLVILRALVGFLQSDPAVHRVGIYTRRNFWAMIEPLLSRDDPLYSLPLWATGDAWSFGGWNKAAMFQNQLNTQIGDITGIDLSVVYPDEIAQVLGLVPDPSPSTTDLQVRLDYLQGDVADAISGGVASAMLAITKALPMTRSAKVKATLADALTALSAGAVPAINTLKSK